MSYNPTHARNRSSALLCLGLLFICVGTIGWTGCAKQPSAEDRLQRINGYLVLHVEGTPEEMGTQHGRALKKRIRRVIDDILHGASYDAERILSGSMKMEPFIPEDYRRELRALARAADVEYRKLVAIQLFGDVLRAQLCTSYAVFGPATTTGECIVGRNMEYFDYGVSAYASVLIHFKPSDGIPFMTVSWAGIINGWTTMNTKGIVVANNTAYGTEQNSLEGVSTCFIVRRVAQFAASVGEGVDIVKSLPRACGTNLLIAGGRPADAAVVEFDHAEIAVRPAKNGVIIADNDFKVLYAEKVSSDDEDSSFQSRYQRLEELIKKNFGKIDRGMNFASDQGVAIRSMNLHSALLFPDDLRFRIAMGKVPACDQPYQPFRMTAEGIFSDESGEGE